MHRIKNHFLVSLTNNTPLHPYQQITMDSDGGSNISFPMLEDDDLSNFFDASIDSSLSRSSSFFNKYNFTIDFGSDLSTIVIESDSDDDSNFAPTIGAKNSVYSISSSSCTMSCTTCTCLDHFTSPCPGCKDIPTCIHMNNSDLVSDA